MGKAERSAGLVRGLVSFRAATNYAVLGRLISYGRYAALVCGNDWIGHHTPAQEIGLAPYEVAGAVLGSLLVLRTIVGHERWWEGRNLWGGIVNRCRHLAILALSYGPDAFAWRSRAVSLIAAFAHAARWSVRH